MKTRFIAIAALAFLGTMSASAQNYKFYGFIRNYAHVDTHEMKALTGDLFSYLPTDTDNTDATYHFTAITSRVGVDVTGYKYNDMTISAKIEGDFYSGVSGVTGTAQFRLRQAYLTMGWNNEDLGTSSSLKMGQAWHPLAADMPDVFSLNTGAPFGPFSRTPLAQYDLNFNNGLSLTLAGLWQMQYTSAGPDGPSANYVKNCGVPEVYAGVSYKNATTTLRAGMDVVTISPDKDNTLVTAIPFFYGQYKKGLFSAKFKTVYAQAGEHVNLNGGYALKADGNGYTATRNSSSWASLSYGKDWQGVLFAGFVKNFGTSEAIADPAHLYFSKNSYSNMNAMWRLTPTIIRNMGKLAIGAEYEITSVQYGDKANFNLSNGLADQDLHWRTNNRFQLMVKFSF